jgi:uncharacterized membrane protein
VSNLVAVAYDDTATAERVRDELLKLADEPAGRQSPGQTLPLATPSLELEDAVIVTRDVDGRVRLDQARSAVAGGAARGALMGGIIGLIFFAPLLGAALGAAAGGARGAASDLGVDQNFMKELGEALPAGGAALIVLVRSGDPDKVLSRIARYGGHVVMSSLSADMEDRLTEALAQFNVPAGI